MRRGPGDRVKECGVFVARYMVRGRKRNVEFTFLGKLRSLGCLCRQNPRRYLGMHARPQQPSQRVNNPRNILPSSIWSSASRYHSAATAAFHPRWTTRQLSPGESRTRVVRLKARRVRSTGRICNMCATCFALRRIGSQVQTRHSSLLNETTWRVLRLPGTEVTGE
jgi:hypothetical protein